MPTRVSGLFNTTLVNAALVLSILVFGPVVVHGATLYVDGQISSASCTTYAPASRSCSGGSARASRTLAGAAAAAFAGDTVYLREGTYSEQLVPPRSGTASLPITFAAYAGEKPILSGVSNPALWIIQRSYVVVDGLTVSNVGGWGRLEDATHNTIRNCTFTVATIQGTTGGLKLVRSTYNKILDNAFDDGNDNITIQESDRNVIQGNTISTGRHSLLSLRCGNYNVVRGNTFSNHDQKDLEIYDCEGTSDAPIKLDATKRNLVENNVIAYTRGSSANYDYNGIQFAGQQGIVRRNVFRDDLGGGINFQYYSNESLYNNRNRVYHNTFYNNRCYGIVGNTGDSSRYYDNRARNNILYRNASCSGAATQTSISNSSLVILSDNAVLTTSPGFVDEAARDLRLAPGSPMIDAAAFLTTTTAAGSGTQITVTDASYFFDGYGIPGEVGDEIQLAGQTTIARVVAVDLAARRLTLDRSLSWAAGIGVALRHNGARPDMGAYESTGGTITPVLLSVTKAGSGAGTVTSSPAGISCGADCSESYNPGTVVTLSQTASAGSSFAGWSGACTGTGSCQVTMSAAASVTATFSGNPYTLTVAKAGSGAGTVTSSPAGISCGADCSESYNPGTVVTLSQTASAGSSFAGWSGACTGTGSCQVTMSAAASVTATYDLNPYTLTVAKTGTGAGTVTSSPAGISCGSDCSESYNSGTVVTLSQTVAAGSSFAGWSGACTGTGSCQVTMSAAASVTATFNLAAPSVGEPVVWMATGGVVVSGNSLTKNGVIGWGNAGGASTKTLAAGDGYVEFTAQETTTYRMLGLSNGDYNLDWDDIDYALYSLGNGTLRVYERGILRGNFGTYASGDKLRVAVAGNVVRYYRNDALLYTSAMAPTYPLLVDAALYTPGATLAGVVISGAWATSNIEPVVWTSAVGVATSGNSLTKSAVVGWGNAGAVSLKFLNARDGFVQHTVQETNTYRMLGLSSYGNSSTSWDDIDFSLYTMGDGTLRVYERGALRGSFGAYAVGDKLRVAVVAGVVRYYRNSTLLYTSPMAPTFPLIVDTALYNTAASLADVVVSRNWVAPYSEPVVWTAAGGVAVASNTLTKTAAIDWGNAGAVSSKSLYYGDGYVQMYVREANTYRIFGLSNGNSDMSWDDIDFGLYPLGNGTLRVYEKGTYRGTFGSYAVGDQLRVAVVAGVVRYYRNGILLYSSPAPPVFPLKVDTALYTPGATLADVLVSRTFQ